MIKKLFFTVIFLLFASYSFAGVENYVTGTVSSDNGTTIVVTMGTNANNFPSSGGRVSIRNSSCSNYTNCANTNREILLYGSASCSAGSCTLSTLTRNVTDEPTPTAHSGNWSAGAIVDLVLTAKMFNDKLNSVASDSDWTVHNNYPTVCGAGEFVRGIGDTLTCIAEDVAPLGLDCKNDYGVTCNGSTDDSTAIQNCLTAAGNASVKIARLPGGTCRLGSNVSIPSNTALIGVQGQTILKPLNTNISNPVLLSESSKSYVYVQDITFDGNVFFSVRNASYKWDASSGDTGAYYLQLSGGGNPGLNQPETVLANEVALTLGTCSTLSDGQWCWGDVDTLGYSTIYVQLAVGDPDGQAVDYVKSSMDKDKNVVTVYQSNHVDFYRCKWQETAGIGVIFSTDVSTSGVRNSEFSYVGRRIYDKTNVSTDRNQGIAYCCGTQANNYDNYVTDNVLDYGGEAQISFLNQSNGIVLRNTMKNGASAGLYISTDKNIRAQYNEAHDNTGNGFDYHGCDHCTIVGNLSYRNGAAGLMLSYTDYTTIDGNVLMNNYTGGTGLHHGGLCIDIYEADATHLTITDNILADDQATPTQDYGLYVRTGGGFNLVDVQVDGNTIYGNSVGNTNGYLYQPIYTDGVNNIVGINTTSPGSYARSLASLLTLSETAAQTYKNTDIRLYNSDTTPDAGSAMRSLSSAAYQNATSGDFPYMTGLNGFAYNINAGNVSSAYAVFAGGGTTNTGSIGTYIAFRADSPSKTSTGNMTNTYGFYAQNMGKSGTTATYGLRILAQSGSTTNYDVYLDGGEIYVGVTKAAVGSSNLCWDGTGGSYWGACSSLRELKENITYTELGLKDILKLQPREFDWKKDKYHEAGFIAEEVEEVNKLFATYTTGTNGVRKLSDVNERAIISALVNAIKELNAKIEKLEALCK
ncbi:MAG: right-handed parallel beta-helix repeat-containing protein [Bacillota bacterium]